MSRNPRDDDYPRSDGSKRPKPFEIEGDWGDAPAAKPELKLDDSRPVAVQEPPQAPSQARASSLEERVEHLEKMMQLTWKVVHDLERKKTDG